MKGICFIEPLFNKVILGEKIQTRRIVPIPKWANVLLMDCCGLFAYDANENTAMPRTQYLKPKYKIGEVVFLKEPYLTGEWGDTPMLYYKYTSEVHTPPEREWRNKFFMPESAARYFIKITGVRAERLQDVSEDDCLKEGIEEIDILSFGSGRMAYAALIDHINGKGTWESSSFVWVYDFEKIINYEK